MKRNAFFYVLYPKYPRLRNLLNSIKILADQSQRTEAHITVRGPYFKRLSKDTLKVYSNKISGEELLITGVSNFFSANQNTVFFECQENKKLREIWNKISYNGFSPHITIYDGTERNFAKKVFESLSSHFRPFVYEVEKVEWLEPKEPNALPLFYLRLIFDYDILNGLLDIPINRVTIENLPASKKLEYIKRICTTISMEYETNIKDCSPSKHSKI